MRVDLRAISVAKCSVAFCLTIAGVPAWAALTHNPASVAKRPSDELQFSRDEIVRRLGVLNDREAALKKLVKDQARMFLALNHGAGGAQFLWEVEGTVLEKRRHLSEYMKVSIREHLREIEALGTQKTELLAEQEWLRIQLNELMNAPILPAQKIPSAFHCSNSPFSGTSDSEPELNQDFGTKTDADTGLKWQSLGWWISRVDGAVKSCASGKIAFSGAVTGRGRVLIVDHGNGTMTLYANLNDDAAAFKKGDVVKAGRVLGTPRERVYFEVRQNGSAINPRLVIPNLKLAKVGV